MLLAIPNCEGWVSPVFDVAARLLVVHISKGRATGRQEATLAENRPDELAERLVKLGVNVLICGAISQPLARCLAGAGIKVLPHICGEADAVLRAYLHGALNRSEFRMPGCAAGRCGWHQGYRRRRGKQWRKYSMKQT